MLGGYGMAASARWFFSRGDDVSAVQTRTAAATETLDDPLERRTTDRLPLLKPVQYRHGGKLMIGELLDIGEEGLRLRTVHPLPLDAQIKLYIPIPGNDERSRMCLLEGQVVWKEGTTVGLSFSDPPPESSHEVRALLRREIP